MTKSILGIHHINGTTIAFSFGARPGCHSCPQLDASLHMLPLSAMDFAAGGLAKLRRSGKALLRLHSVPERNLFRGEKRRISLENASVKR
jgi:hypothetical protein